MNEKELQRLKQHMPLVYALWMYRMNPCDFWKNEIRELYLAIPEDQRIHCIGDMDNKDTEIKKILGIGLLA